MYNKFSSTNAAKKRLSKNAGKSEKKNGKRTLGQRKAPGQTKEAAVQVASPYYIYARAI